MNKQIVAQITTVHPATDVRIFRKECLTLAKAGYEVLFVVPSRESAQLLDHPVKFRPIPVVENRLQRMLISPIRAVTEIIKSDADLCHFHDPELLPAAILLRCLGKKVIYDVHENVPADIKTKEYLHPLVRGILAQVVSVFEKCGVLFFNRVVAATPSIAQRFPRTKTVLVQNFPTNDWIEEEELSNYDSRPNDIAYVGGLSEYRGIRPMVESMSFVTSDLRARLRVFGVFSPESLEQSAPGIPGWSNVDYQGWQKPATVRTGLASVRAGVIVFQPGPNHSDSQPNKLFEYMSAGLPVIASDFPLWREIVDRVGCGLLVDPADPKAIGGAIEWILKNPDEARQMGLRGLRAVKSEFNWEKESRKLLNMYAELSGDRNICAE